MTSGGAWRCGRGLGIVEILRSSKLHGSMRGGVVKVHMGSGRAKGHRRRGITVAAELTSGGNSRKFPSVQASESRVEALGSFLVTRRS